jgi:hypothetical protein
LRETDRPSSGFLLLSNGLSTLDSTSEPLFTTDLAFDVAELLEVNQAMDTVSFGEATHDFRSMLEYAPNKIACDADIERAANLTSEDVHPENLLVAHRQYRDYWIARLRGR